MKKKKVYNKAYLVSFFVLIMLQAALPQRINFYARHELSSGDVPLWTAVGDLNEDGYQDIAVVNAGNNGNSVSVFINITPDQDSAPSFLPKSDFNTGSNPVAVAISDINLDYKEDIITANGNGNSMGIC